MSNCTITFVGLNVNRLLNGLCKMGVEVRGFYRKGKQCVLCVPSSDAAKATSYLQAQGCRVLSQHFAGSSGVMRFLRRHFLLPVACVVCVAALLFSSRLCLRVEVSGDFPRSQVLLALDQSGVGLGSDLGKLNVDALENELANRLNAMYAVVSRSGSVLHVKTVAKRLAVPPIDMNCRRDVIATRSGVVTRLVCEQGTPCVQVGDRVNVGDILIEGKRTYNDGTFDEVYALGRVELQVSVSACAQFDGCRSEVVETGRTFVADGIVLFGKEYCRACPFDSYTQSSSETSLFPLNLTVRRNVYRETQLVTVPATLAECVAQLKEQAYMSALKLCDFTVCGVEYAVTDGGVTATLYGSVIAS